MISGAGKWGGFRLKDRIEEIKRFEEMSLYEKELHRKGVKLVAGVDEAGRGPLAGPVVAAAVILPVDVFIEGLNDSAQSEEKPSLAR